MLGNVLESFVEGLEEFGEGHGVELGEEASHGFIVGAFALQEAVVADVMAAESFIAEGGGLAKFAGGQEVSAEGEDILVRLLWVVGTWKNYRAGRSFWVLWPCFLFYQIWRFICVLGGFFCAWSEGFAWESSLRGLTGGGAHRQVNPCCESFFSHE